MKLTKKQREQVVELLRCAADMGSTGGLYEAAAVLTDRDDNGYMVRPPAWLVLAHARAVKARLAVEGESPWLMSYEDTCLEAAARVEEGSWP